MNQFQKFVAFGLLAFLGLSLFGCGSGGPSLVPAAGTVLYEGKPLTSGSILFQPEQGQHSRAIIAADGTFSMSTLREGDGAPVGKHMVRVVSAGETTIDQYGEESFGKSAIPKAYSNFRTSGITVDIPPEGSDSIVIELKKSKR